MSWLPDWLTGYDAENAERAAAADLRLQNMNAVDYAPGGSIYERAASERGTAYADDLLDRVQLDFDSQSSFNPDDQRAEIDTAFVEGAAEGLKSAQDKFKGWLSSIGLGVLGFIPWWVWLLALGFLWFKYLGGSKTLRRLAG